jgi:hypothetical protein
MLFVGGKLDIEIERTVWVAGEVLRGSLKMVLRKEFTPKNLSLEFYGIEET